MSESKRLTDKDIKKGKFYRHRYFGILRIVSSFKEGSKDDRRTVWIGIHSQDQCDYNAMACEFTEECTAEQWFLDKK